MKNPSTFALAAALSTLTLAASPAAQAQGTGSAFSVLPGTTRGYVGINLGRPEYTTSCGTPGLSCDDPDGSLHVYTGGLLNDMFGLELGYVNTGRADRAGGTARAHGLTVSALARAPIGPVGLFAKAGFLYGRTEVTSNALSGVPQGTQRGWGPTFGLGAGYDLTESSTVVLQWDRYSFDFPGVGREPVKVWSLGYVHRF